MSREKLTFAGLLYNNINVIVAYDDLILEEDYF